MQNTNSILNKAMLLLASHSSSIFIGQNVLYDGNIMFHHLEGIDTTKRIELPVCEELQLGISIGLSLQGFLPISIYPRMDFLLRSMDQLVNHLDKLEEMTYKQFRPKIIIRTRVGPKYSLNAGPQHTQDHTEALCKMLTNIEIFKITNLDNIISSYSSALYSSRSSLVVENLQ